VSPWSSQASNLSDMAFNSASRFYSYSKSCSYAALDLSLKFLMFCSIVWTFEWILSRSGDEIIPLTWRTSCFCRWINCIALSSSLERVTRSFFSYFSHSIINSAKSFLRHRRGRNLSLSSIITSFLRSLNSRIHSFLSKPSTVTGFAKGGFESLGGLPEGYFWPNAILGAGA